MQYSPRGQDMLTTNPSHAEHQEFYEKILRKTSSLLTTPMQPTMQSYSPMQPHPYLCSPTPTSAAPTLPITRPICLIPMKMEKTVVRNSFLVVRASSPNSVAAAPAPRPRHRDRQHKSQHRSRGHQEKKNGHQYTD